MAEFEKRIAEKKEKKPQRHKEHKDQIKNLCALCVFVVSIPVLENQLVQNEIRRFCDLDILGRSFYYYNFLSYMLDEHRVICSSKSFRFCSAVRFKDDIVFESLRGLRQVDTFARKRADNRAFFYL